MYLSSLPVVTTCMVSSAEVAGNMLVHLSHEAPASGMFETPDCSNLKINMTIWPTSCDFRKEFDIHVT